ncbi:hypothetical protein [Haloechinothrix halophila]|uniref:hypothetical protein n=1 Tax=Haloechinothrix halophila TaxID=1069073 RepID=UPI000411B4AE|nr:hypothetical protein [Haloechinothrix halophila]
MSVVPTGSPADEPLVADLIDRFDFDGVARRIVETTLPTIPGSDDSTRTRNAERMQHAPSGAEHSRDPSQWLH